MEKTNAREERGTTKTVAVLGGGVVWENEWWQTQYHHQQRKPVSRTAEIGMLEPPSVLFACRP